VVKLSPLDRKLLRDLRRIGVQAVAVALLVACAVALFVGSAATWRALARSQARYYESHRFAEVFAEARRVPEPVAARISRLPGVAEVETRVVAAATVELPGDPAARTARALSLAPGGPRLNRVHVRAGRLPAPGAADEALVSEGFALANRLAPGDRIAVVIEGRRQSLRVAGVAISPEVVYALRPGDVFPDDRHFGILWLPLDMLAAAAGMEGAFDEVSLALAPGASEAGVIAGLDRLLAPYGGAGAYGRDHHVSHRFLSDEVRQLKSMAAVMPAIFLGVAAFLVSIVLSRLVAAQRPQIGMLKAVGYRAAEIGLHYAKLVGLVAAAGAVAGVPLGALLGKGLARTYADFYRLPELVFEGDLATAAIGVLVAVGAALAGASGAVRAAVTLPPAEAMRPPAPPSYRRTLLDRLGLAALAGAAGRMVLRDVARRPARAALSALGLAFAVAILLVAWFASDAIALMFVRVLGEAQRQDVTVIFTHGLAPEALPELRAVPGVRRVEPFLTVPAVLRSGHRSHRGAVTGLSQGAELTRLLRPEGSEVSIPPRGLVLSLQLARMLHVKPGGEVRVEVLEGRRAARRLPVAAVVEDFVGVQAHAELGWLADAIGEPPRVSGVQLAVDRAELCAVEARLRGMPRVAGSTLRASTIAAFHEVIDEFLGMYLGVIGALALAIAAGVVYASARVTYAERERELATLRVVGFTRGEIWRVVAGEVALHLAAAVPAGWALGLLFVSVTARMTATDLYRLPTFIARSTYASAALVVAAGVAAVSLVAVRWIRRLDLVEVLKSRE